MFSVRIFRHSVVGHEYVFEYCATELVSESLFDGLVEVKPINILLFLIIRIIFKD